MTARRIIDANSYMTLGTADADGRPWATPVWFAPDGYTDFIRVYVEAFAQEVPAAEVESAIATFSARLERDGGSPWQVADVVGSASFRLYRARASAHYLLGAKDSRVPVDPNAT
jgi:hypothetical protein